MSAFTTGPHIAAAFLCERVLAEQDGVHSYIRVVDKIVRQVVSPQEPEHLPPHQVQLTLVLVIKAGQARGSFPLSLEIERPSGERGPKQSQRINFSGGPQNGVNLQVIMDLAFDQQGVWWIDVLGGEQEQLMTRIPIEFQDSWIMGQTPQAPSSGL